MGYFRVRCLEGGFSHGGVDALHVDPFYFMQTVAVIIASYGDRDKWNRHAQKAVLSIANQNRPPDQLIRYHGESLHQARNKAASWAETNWLCFLDCDDALEPDYLLCMMAREDLGNELRYPRVRYVSENLMDPRCIPEPVTLPSRPLWTGNFMVIGTLIKTSLFSDVGGFRNLPAYEDWDLWIRAWLHGANPRLVPGAIYQALRRHDGRNIVLHAKELFQQIIMDNKAYAARRQR